MWLIQLNQFNFQTILIDINKMSTNNVAGKTKKNGTT